jgi:hypothetical protein
MHSSKFRCAKEEQKLHYSPITFITSSPTKSTIASRLIDANLPIYATCGALKVVLWQSTVVLRIGLVAVRIVKRAFSLEKRYDETMSFPFSTTGRSHFVLG